MNPAYKISQKDSVIIMITYLKANLWTIVIVCILIIIVALIIRNLIKNKKNGIGTCGGDCSSCHSGCANSAASNYMVKTTVHIDGMVCGMCESHINDVIRQNFDVTKVKSSCKKGITVMISSHRLDNNLLKEVIKNTGYEVKKIDIEFN